MPEFEVLAELGDYALIRVTYPSGSSIYTARRSDKEPDRFFTKAVKEDFFWDLVEMAKEKRESEGEEEE